MVRRLIVVSNRLPVSAHEENGVLSLSRSNGGLATALAPLFQQDTSLWVGWLGLRRNISRKELDELDIPAHLLPINLTSNEITGYYDQFSNGILWPLAHGLPATVHFDPAVWRAAKAVTQKFADRLQQVITPTDTIWIHDYHLMLLPGELRKRGMKNRIGFFLHTPFPPPEVIVNTPHFRELLQSVLSVNVIGLQVARDVKRFHAVCDEFDMRADDQPLVKSFPIGIDFDSFDRLNDSPEVQKMASTFTKQTSGKKIILSLSRLDYTKGILAQLRAFEMLIKKMPDSQDIIYRLNIAPSRESVPEYKDLRQEIERQVDAINKAHATSSWQPVIYTYENIGQNEIAAWCQISEVHLNLPISDGMNLVAKEYIAARRTPGMLIITSTMGAADQLKDALVVPPENPSAAAHALEQAFKMPENEKRERWKTLRQNVKTHQAAEWAQDFLNTLTK
jgi:trehalose 6-phosphate synthase/phosphatase